MRLSATWCQNVLIGYICIWATAPPLAYGDVYRLAAILAVISWSAIEASRPMGVFRRPTLPVVLAFAYIFYVSAVELLFNGASGILRNLQIFIALFFIVVHESRRHAPKTLLPVFWLVLLTMPCWYVASLKVLWTENSHAARLLVRSGSEAQALSARGVGGYALTYFTVLIMPALLSLAVRLRKARAVGGAKLLRSIPGGTTLILWANILLGCLFVLNSGYFIAVLLLAIGCFAALLMRNYNPVKLLFFSAAASCFALFATEILEASLKALLPLAEGSNFQLKIRDLLASLRVEEAMGTLSDRTERYSRSFALFLQSPLIGTLSFDDIGKHSQVLDEFAQYGIVIGAVFTYLSLFLPIRYLRRTGYEYGAALGTFCAILGLYSLNNSFSGAGVAIYILFPASIYLVGGLKSQPHAS